MASIREVSSEELDTLLKLAIKIFTDAFGKENNPNDLKTYIDEAFTEEKIESEFAEIGSQFFVAYEEGQMIGYARVRENDEPNFLLGKNNLELQRLYVDLPFQGMGIAKQLMDECEAFAKSKNKEWLWLGVWEHNYKAQHFYQKNSFKKFSEHQFTLGSDVQTDWLMKKKLR